ncbi:unnamed protein product [Ambrosiozyma monospora]|uniref:Unnamed protein product n=1 Tax=Ambrosiozyma monospora TaxID=43982 RepID=A0ACB5SXU5_AMBMO|nr:unnamed protein product [Ambrosiozyma monospora]
MCSRVSKYPDSSIHEHLPENVAPLHYKLQFYDLDISNGTSKATAAIDFQIKDKTTSVTLNQKFLDIISAKAVLKVTKTEQELNISNIIKDDKKQTVEFQLDTPNGTPIQAGDLTLIIDYKCKIRNDMAGFYSSTFKDEKTGKLEYILCTQFEATDARSAFPCYDEPNAKATFDVSLTVHKTLTVLSNMPESSSKGLGDGKKGPAPPESASDLKIVEFETTPKMSTYLVAWAIGKFEYVEGSTLKEYNGRKLPIRIYTIPGQSQNGQYALGCAQKAVDYLSGVFDIDYPLPKLDLIAIPEFGANAMENWGMVTFRATALLFDFAKSDISYQQNVAYVVSHEIAHSWFGNYCTMNWWSDLWLNESFATYVGWLSVQNMHPEWNVFIDFVSTAVQPALDLDSLRNSHPIEVQVYHADEIDEIFDAISYLKGGSVVRMVAESIGVELFLKGVSQYLKAHPFGNAKSNDLWDSISAVSGQNITELVEPWIRAIGFPYLTVSKANDQEVKITQQRFLSSGDAKPEEDETVWWLPNVDATKVSKTHTVPLDSLLHLNKETNGFYRVVYDDFLFEKILQNLDKLSASDKIGLIADTAAGAQAGLIKTSQFLKLLSGLKNEDNVSVWSEIITRLNNLKGIFFEDKQLLSQLSKFSKDLYNEKFNSIWGIEADKLSFSDSKLRSRLFIQTGATGSQPALEYAEKTIKDASYEPSLKLGVFKTLLSNESTCTRENFNIVLQEVKFPTSIDSREIALKALGSISKPDEFLDEVLGLYFTESLPEMDYRFLTGALTENPLTKSYQVICSQFGV